jgi:hypothetical protein
MAPITVPQWVLYFFMAEGALSVLTFDGVLDRAVGQGAHSIAGLAFLIAVVWWARYRGRITK